MLYVSIHFMTDRDNYNQIFDNGVAHIDSAKLLASKGYFGFAISHLILGIEELIKYQVVYSYFSNNRDFDKDVDPNEKNSVFTKHFKKHDLLKEFQLSMTEEFTTAFQDYVFHRATGQELTEKHLEIEKNRFKEWGNLFRSAFAEINIPDEKKDAFFCWLKNANNMKNQGFYVNWESAIFESPKSIIQSSYENALEYASAILMQTEVIKSMDLTGDEFMDMLNSDLE